MEGTPKRAPTAGGKARVADHLRRRALVSCDRCKKRRIRCIRPVGSDAHDACQACLDAVVECKSTLPRKTRIYGSVETLSIRYRVLDSLVKSIFSQEDTSDINTLCAIAKARGINLPTSDEHVPMDDVFSNPNILGASPDPSTVSATSASKETPQSPTEPVVEEKLVPLPRGPSHYIGPSSSFGFVLIVRNMVAKFNSALKNQLDDERAKISAEFAGSNWSKALEPINKDESDSNSDQGSHAINRRPLPKKPQSAGTNGPRSTSAVTAMKPKSSKRMTLLSLFPEREVSDAFINAYFDNIHHNYLVLHRKTFEVRYNDMWSRPSTLVRNVEPGWLCCLSMMMVFGAQALEDRDMVQSAQIQRHYLDLVQDKMHQLISATTLVNVQALLLLQLYQHNCTERNSAFMLLGCASRMAMALGMHRGGTSGGFDDVEREIRKRVWWTTYSFEQYQCAILGRPCAIDDTEVNVNFPNESLLDDNHSVPLGYVEYSVRLTKLMSEIRRRIYAASGGSKHGDFTKVDVAIQFLMDLDAWHNSLPAHLQLEHPSHPPKHHRAVILLHAQFHHIQALVTRPFLLRKVSVQLARRLGKHVRSQDLDKEELDLSHSCGTSSRKTAILLHELLTIGLFDGVAWMDAYYVYHAVFILALDFLARPLDHLETSSEDGARIKVVRDVTSAMQSTKLCPTFKVLIQVSLQLSKIVGIVETTPDPFQTDHRATEVFQPPTTQQHLQNLYPAKDATASQPGVEVAVNSWFQKEPIPASWEMNNFFGVDGYVGPLDADYSDLPMAMTNGFNMQIPGILEHDDFVPPLPSNIGFTQWGAIDAPFVPVRRGPASSTYKGGN